MDPVLCRRRRIVRRRLEGWQIKNVADPLQISERTVDRRWSVYRSERCGCLRVKSRKPHRYYKTPESTVDLILELRCSKRWGPNNVDWYLRNYRVRRITPVSHRTIHGILVNAGLNNPISAPRRVWGKRRFERVRSIELWQADFRQAGDDKWMISYLDDYSRFTLGSKILYNPTGEYPIHPLIDCIHQYGKPHQLLTDQGTHFIGPRGDLFTFTEFCN